MVFFFFTMLTVFGSSTLYHTLVCGSECRAGRCHLFDISSIILHVSSAFFTGVHFGFKCWPNFQRFYLLWASVVTAGLAFSIANKGKKEGGHVLGFCICSFSGLVPACHWIFIATEVEGKMMLYPIFGGCMWYAIGVFFFIRKIPERYLPTGTCDYVFQSHQIWHVCVFLAAKAFMQGFLALHQFDMNHPCDLKRDWPRFWR